MVELWDLFHQVGMERRKPFVDVYSHLDRKDFEALAKWDRDVNRGRIFRPWQRVTHPQLGDVDVGGLDLLVGISNPPFELLPQVCEQQADAFLRVAALAPRVTVEVKSVGKVAPSLSRVEVRIANRGYLSTYGLSSAKKLRHSEPLRLAARGEGITVTVPEGGTAEVGHLEGWGRGLYNGINIFAPWTRGNAHERYVTILASGRGTLSLRVGSCRVGFRTVEVLLE